jgi:hypothetical protein
VYYDGTEIYEVPQIIRNGFTAMVKNFYAFTGGKFFDMPLESMEMGGARYGGDYKKIGPAVELPQIQNHYIAAIVFPKQLPQS